MRILLAGDDRDLVDMLRCVFQRDSYSVSTAFVGEATLPAFQADCPDLIVLDLLMPKKIRLEVLAEIRRVSKVPIIVLTSVGDEENTVNALDGGADDYLAKPFRPRELRARVKSQLRRGLNQAEGEEKPKPLLIGDMQLNARTQEVSVSGRFVKLTPTEFALLQHFKVNYDQVLSSSDLIANVWGYDAEGNEELVRVTISRLRHKIEPDPSSPRYIVNVPGVGYRFVYRRNEG
jgi:DNA-binding response OmpR family regulator